MRADARLVVLLGHDGSGKTTLLGEFASAGYKTSSWHQLSDAPEMEFMRPATIDPGEYRNPLPPLTRAAYLVIAMFSQYELFIRPALESGQMVIVDSYYIRPVAKELAKGVADRTHLLQSISHLPPPTDVLLLDLPAEVAFERKKGSLYPHDYERSPSLSDFAAHQQRILDVSLGLCGQSVTSLDATASVAMVFNSAVHSLAL